MVSSDDAVFLTVAMIYDEWLIKLYDYAQSWDGATCDILEIVVGASLDLVQFDGSFQLIGHIFCYSAFCLSSLHCG